MVVVRIVLVKVNSSYGLNLLVFGWMMMVMFVKFIRIVSILFVRIGLCRKIYVFSVRKIGMVKFNVVVLVSGVWV